jgi:nicotinamide-nucleotide amidase
VDDADFAAAVVAWLGSRTLACAESCTAGKLSQVFAAVGGAEEWFRGGLVAYQVPVKRSLLGVTETSVLNETAAEEMAVGVASLLRADVTVSTSGLVGGERQDGVAPGTVFIATFVDGAVTSRAHHFEGEPQEVVDAVVRQALCDLLLDVGAQAGDAASGESSQGSGGTQPSSTWMADSSAGRSSGPGS